MAVSGRVIGDGGDYGGDYVPEIFDNNAIATVNTIYETRYQVSNKEISVNFRFTVTPSSLSLVDLRISLPVDSNHLGTSVAVRGSGQVTNNTLISESLFIFSDGADPVSARIQFTPTSTAIQTISGLLTYDIKG